MLIFAITLYLVAYLCTLINAEAVGIPTGRIYHGTEVTNCETYPWHAQLYYTDPDGKKRCGGTLISDKFVLTASHCSDECKVGSDYTIYLGSTKKNEGTKYEGILKACIDSSINLDKDVAVVELTTSVSITNCIDVLPILDVNDSIQDDLLVTAVGFGDTETTKYPESLQETTSLRILNKQLCEKEFNYTPGLLTAHICTKSKIDEGQNNCNGDSGGSLFTKVDGNKAVLLGITSIVTEDCSAGVTIYAKVNEPVIFNWIKDMIEN